MDGQSFIDMQIAIAALYIIYPLFMRGKVEHRAARIYLLSIFPLSAIIASVKIPFWVSPPTSAPLNDAPMATISDISSTAADQATPYAAYIYWAGVAIMALWLIVVMAKVVILCCSIKPQNGIRYISDGGAFSFFGAIFISTKYNDDNREIIVAHERCHWQYLHSIDVIYCNLCRVMLWFNPFVWLISHSLRQVHEWQADHYVIKTGVNKIQYIDLLLDARSATNIQVVNSINYSLTKKRIIMITKNQKRSAMRLSVALPVVAALVFFMSLTTKANPNQTTTAAIATPIEVIDENEPVAYSEVMPKFRSDSENSITDFRKWVQANIVYPEKAKKEGTHGRVVVRFVVETDGTVSNVTLLRGVSNELNQATTDAVAKSPKWDKPAYDKGKAVRFTFILPVDFE